MVSFQQMQPTIQNGEPVVSLQLAAGKHKYTIRIFILL